MDYKRLVDKYGIIVVEWLKAEALKRLAKRGLFLSVDPPENTGAITEEKVERPDLELGEIELQDANAFYKDIEKAYTGNFAPVNQKSIGTCAIWTVQNAVNYWLYKNGYEQSIEVDISYMYKTYRANTGKGQDTGTVVEDLWRKLEKDGIPLRVVDPILDSKDLLALDTRLFVINDQLKLKLIQGIADSGNTLDHLIADTQNLDSNTILQVSLDVYRYKTSSKSPYWFKKYIKWEDDVRKTGRHSVLAFPAVLQEKERGIWIIDSGDGMVKFLGESYIKNADFSYRLYKFNQNAPVAKINLANITLRFGDKGAEVVELQKLVKAPQTGVYDLQTANKLSAWLLEKTGVKYPGKLWGAISQKVYSGL